MPVPGLLLLPALAAAYAELEHVVLEPVDVLTHWRKKARAQAAEDRLIAPVARDDLDGRPHELRQWMVDARPLCILEERDAVILEDETHEVAVRFAIAHEQAYLAVMPALVAHEAQDIGRRALDFEPPVGGLDELHALLLRLSRAAVAEELLLHAAQDARWRKAVLLCEQVDRHRAAIAELLARHAADGLQRPVRPVEECRLLQVLRQVEPDAAITFCKAGHRQGDVDLGGRHEQSAQHGHLLRIEEDEAVEPDLRPLEQGRFGDGFGELVHHVLRIVGLALHL